MSPRPRSHPSRLRSRCPHNRPTECPARSAFPRHNLRQRPRRGTPLLAALAGLLAAGAVLVAQPDAPAPSESRPEAPARMSLNEATEKAVALLDALDDRWGEPPTRGELDQLNAYILAIQAADASDPRIHYLYGRAFALMGRTGSAITELQKYLDTREGKNEWKAYRALGELFIEEFPRMALSNFEKAAALKPDEPAVLVGLSRSAYGVGDLDTALQKAREAVAADRGEHVRPGAHLARMFAANQQWNEADRTAVAAVEKAARRMQEEPARRGPAAVLQEQYDLLIGILQSRIGAPGAAPGFYARLGAAMRERAAVAEQLALHDALSVLESGMRGTDDAPPELLLEYAITLAELDRTAEAVSTFEKVLDADPENPTAREWLSRLRSDASAASTTSSRP